ncbi:MAG: TetR/AcrR family transcriptional regulator, partial [Bacillota bacterium]|nr:TetR/AcrR family transcriptional regulator [Bacillota bacterium]
KELLKGLMIPLILKFFKPMMFNSLENIMKKGKDRPIDEVMKDIMIDRLNLGRKNKKLLKTMILESFYHDELLNPIKEQIAPKIMPFIDDFMKDNINKGNFKELDPRFIERTALSMIIGYFVLTDIFPEIFPSEDEETEIDKMVDVFLNGTGKKE